MPARFGDPVCERARDWVSLDLDGELSQLERALLRAHLRRCEPCAARAAEMRLVTTTLRAAPLERPSRPLFAPSAHAPARPPRRIAVRVALAATLAALAAGFGVLASSLREGPAAPVAPSAPEIALLPVNEDVGDLRGLHGRDSSRDRRELPPNRSSGV